MSLPGPGHCHPPPGPSLASLTIQVQMLAFFYILLPYFYTNYYHVYKPVLLPSFSFNKIKCLLYNCKVKTVCNILLPCYIIVSVINDLVAMVFVKWPVGSSDSLPRYC